jgi:hypothetical protein
MWPIVIDSTGCSCGVSCRGLWLILKIIINREDRAMIAVTVKVGRWRGRMSRVSCPPKQPGDIIGSGRQNLLISKVEMLGAFQ